ncbi:MAG: protein kinase [Myxococcales bacterium]|nr:protein kinase [Myxococcales bacterium]
MKLRPGVFIGNGKYKLVARLGEGGQAEVWGAVQIGLGDFSKEVVLKCVHLDDKTGPEQRGMLLHEARLAARLQHPNIVEIYDVGEEQDLVYIAMERIQGYDLEVILDRCKDVTQKPIPWSLAVYVVIEVSKGLHYAHTHVGRDGRPLHLVHRDLKPSNILLSRNGFVKVIDFGIAKATNRPTQEGNTLNGQIKGTPAYMSPEQIYARQLDARSDLFALGSILYELCCGERPFSGDEVFSIMMAVTQNMPTSLFASTPGIPAQLEDAVFKLLEKEPDKRFQNARDLQRELDMILRERDLYIDQEDLARFYEETMGDFVPTKNESSLWDASQDFQSLAQEIGDYGSDLSPSYHDNHAGSAYAASGALGGMDVWDMNSLGEGEEFHGDETMAGDETFLESAGLLSSQADVVDVIPFTEESLSSGAPSPAGKLDTRQLPAFQGPQPLSDLLGSSEALPASASSVLGDLGGGDSESLGVDFPISDDALSLLGVYDGKEDLLDLVHAPTETFIPAVIEDDGDSTNLVLGASPHATLDKKAPSLSDNSDLTSDPLGLPTTRQEGLPTGALNTPLPRPPMVSLDNAREKRPSAHEIPAVSPAASMSGRPPSVHEIPRVGDRPPSVHEIPRIGDRPPSVHEIPRVGRPPSVHEIPRVGASGSEHDIPRATVQLEDNIPARLETPPKPLGAGVDDIQQGSVSFAEVRLKTTTDDLRSGGGLNTLASSSPAPRTNEPLRQPMRNFAGASPLPRPEFAVHPPEYAPSELSVDAAGRFAPRVSDEAARNPVHPLHASARVKPSSDDDSKTTGLLLRVVILVGVVGLVFVSYAAFQFLRSRTLENGKAHVKFDFQPVCQISQLSKADPDRVTKALGLSSHAKAMLEPGLYYFLCENEDKHLSFYNINPYNIRNDRRIQTIKERFHQINVTLVSTQYPSLIFHPRFKAHIGETGKAFTLTIPHRDVSLRIQLKEDPRIFKTFKIAGTQENDLSAPIWSKGEVKKLREAILPRPVPPREVVPPRPRVKKRRRRRR